MLRAVLCLVSLVLVGGCRDKVMPSANVKEASPEQLAALHAGMTRLAAKILTVRFRPMEAMASCWSSFPSFPHGAYRGFSWATCSRWRRLVVATTGRQRSQRGQEEGPPDHGRSSDRRRARSSRTLRS